MDTKRNAPLLHIADKIMRECVMDPSRLGVIFVLSVLGKSPVREDYDGFSISASFQKQNDLDDYISKRYQACLSKCHGMSSSMRAAGWPAAIASRVALR